MHERRRRVIVAAMPHRSLDLLTELLAQPTAPFREMHVARWVEQVFAAADVPHFTDPLGNIAIGADSVDAYRRRQR